MSFYTSLLLMRNFILLLILGAGLLGCKQQPDGTMQPTIAASPRPTTTPTELIVPTALPTPTAVSNTPTPFPTPTITPTPTPVLYTIQEGETLLGIAIAQGTTTEAILALNPEVRPEALGIGQVIILPSATAVIDAPIEPNTAVAPNLTITQLHTYETVVGSFWVIGEVSNAGEQAVENVQIDVRFLDDAGSVADTAVTWVANPIIPAGESAPFGLQLPQAPSFAQIESAVTQSNVVAEVGDRYLEFAVTETGLNTEQPAAQIRGVVQNVGAETAVSVQLIITLYDSEGNLVGFIIRPVADELLAGETMSFKETAVSLAAPVANIHIAPFAYKATTDEK